MNKDPEHPSRIVDRYLSRYRTESSLGQNFLIDIMELLQRYWIIIELEVIRALNNEKVNCVVTYK